MGVPHGYVIPLLSVAAACHLSGCSSGPDRSSQGSLTVKLASSRAVAASDPPIALTAARITLSELEARRSDGTWFPAELDPASTFDLLGLEAGGVTVSPHLLPEGQYNALRLRISAVDLTLAEGSRVPMPRPQTGWVSLVPADFSIACDRATVVGLRLDPRTAIRGTGDRFEFEPEFTFDGVERR